MMGVIPVRQEEQEEHEVADVYDRQRRIEGWMQGKIDSAKVVVVGSGQLSNCVSAGCAALGVGHVRIIGSGNVNGGRNLDSASEGFLLFEARKGESKIKALTASLRQINPNIQVSGIDAPLGRDAASNFGMPTTVIDATNNYTSKFYSYEWCRKQNVPFISTMSSATKCSVRIFGRQAKSGPAMILEERIRALINSAWVHVNEADIMPGIYEDLPQGNATSGIAAGIAIGELRSIIMPMETDGRPVLAIDYDSLSSKRVSLDGPKQSANSLFYNKTILIIGGGAIGNYTSLWSCLTGARVIIADGDNFEPTNLNRQILAYGAIGKKKASALSNRLSQITGRDVGFVIGYIDENFTKWLKEISPDLIISGVDSVEARIHINNLVLMSGLNVPIIDASAGVRGGEIYFAYPGRTKCIRYQRWGPWTDLKEMISDERKAAEERRKTNRAAREGCAYSADPSVIMPNLVVGGLAVAEAMHVFTNPSKLPAGYLMYNLSARRRLQISGTDASGVENCYTSKCVLGV